MKASVSVIAAHPQGERKNARQAPAGRWPFLCRVAPSGTSLGLPGLWQTLEKLPRIQWPTFSRGDCGYGWQALETTLRLSKWSKE